MFKKNCLCTETINRCLKLWMAKRLLPILRAASSPLPSQNFARANDPAGYAGYGWKQIPIEGWFFFIFSYFLLIANCSLFSIW